MSIQKRPLKGGGVSYLARYVAPDGKTQPSQSFRKRADAVAWLAEQQVAEHRGDWIDPAAGKITFGTWVEEWQPTRAHLRKSSAVRDTAYLRSRILPRWKDVPLKDIQYMDVAAWVAALRTPLAPETVHKVAGIFSMIMGEAVHARKLRSNPADGVHLPPIDRDEIVLPTAKEVAALADAIDPRYRALVLFGAYTGLRFSEMAGLKWRRLNLLDGSVFVAEQAYECAGTIVWGPPKNRKPRKVPIPRFICEELATLTEANPDSDALVFRSPRGMVLRRSSFRSRTWLPAREKVGLTMLTPHDLRHYAISLWLQEGMPILEASRRAGHARASITLDRYGHLFPDTVDTLTPKLDAVGRKAQSG